MDAKKKKWLKIGGIALVAMVGLGALLEALGIEGTPAEEEPVEQATEQSDSDPPEESDPDPEPAEDEEPEPERPTVTDDHTGVVESFAIEEAVVQDAHVSVEDDEVVISLIVNAATNEDEARRLLDNAARLLASQVAADAEGLAGPSADELGELWDYYTLHVMAGPNPDDMIARGAKVPSSPRITW